MNTNKENKLVGVQISPISFQEGLIQYRYASNGVGVNVLLIGTVSWLGLKSGRSVSWKNDGWPDCAYPNLFHERWGYFDPDPKC